MLIVDASNVFMANLFAHMADEHAFEESLLRHMVLTSLKGINKRFGKKYGIPILARDFGRSWRREIFPNYKANRDKTRSESSFDWKTIFKSFNVIHDEIRDYMPYPVVEATGAEADDVIGVLVRNKFQGEEVMIVSADKDMGQLHGPEVLQYDYIKKKDIEHQSDPENFLKEHIIRGDVGDGIPNVFSHENTLVTEGARQKPATVKKVSQVKAQWMDGTLATEDLAAYDRVILNQRLIDLKFTPLSLQIDILASYANQQDKGRKKIYPYFVKRGLSTLLADIAQF